VSRAGTPGLSSRTLLRMNAIQESRLEMMKPQRVAGGVWIAGDSTDEGANHH
jgi:hypothetical protein